MNTKNLVTENNFEALATLVSDFISNSPGERITDSEPPVGTAHMSNFDLWTKEADYKMQNGELPDLRPVLLEIYRTFTLTQQPYSARQFIPILKSLKVLNQKESVMLTALSGRNIVLAKNDLIKASLIHWSPGKTSSIHGHPSGGCTFRVFHGRVVEERFSSDGNDHLLDFGVYKSDQTGYIDDSLAFHRVSNPFTTPAISLHIYTPGR